MSDPPDPLDDIGERETLERPGEATLDERLTPRPSRPGPRGLPSLRPGQAFGPYRLIRVLGQGGFGQVWEAEATESGRRVALKVVTRETSPESRQRFEREGRLAASLNHPHCVYVLAAETIDGHPAIAMELMPGGTLEDLVRRDGPMPARQAVDHALDILEGLAAAHAAGILHRDLKPSNCFLDDGGRVRIGDFGLSKTLELDARITVEGSFLGTPAYASPEQVRGNVVDPRSDYYALGATLYALLTGKPPFGGRELGSVLSRILTEDPPPPSSHGVSLPRGLEKVVLRLLAKDPARRPGTVAAVRAALLPFSSHGLAPGDQPRRFAAFVADLWGLSLVEACLGALLFPAIGIAWLAASGWVVCFVYFFGFEAAWSRTPGKAAFGLRVTGAGGAPPSVGRIALRTLVFCTLYEGDNLLAFLVGFRGAGRPLPAVQAVVMAVSVAMVLSLLVTMRRRNGFAGLHEVASRTRVQAVPAQETVVVPEAAPPSPPAGAPRRFGPYEEIAPLWDERGESLILARDPALRRRVFIHRFADPSRARSIPEAAAHAPGRLRWLQGTRGAATSWDAYEAPGGSSLVEWVRSRGRLEWREAREVLLGLARALAAVRGEGGPEALSLHRVWADGAVGHVRLAPFRVASDGAEIVVPLEDWRGFLRQALTFALEGRLASPADLVSPPRAVVPEHARGLLQRLYGIGPAPETPEALVGELESLCRRPGGVSRRPRVLSLAAPAVLPPVVVTVVAIAVSLWGFDRTARGVAEIRERVQVLEALDRASDPASQESREAQREVIAALHAAIRGRLGAEQAIEHLTANQRRLIEEAARDYPAPTADSLQAALARAGPVRPRQPQEFSLDPLRRAEHVIWAWRLLALCAVLHAPFTGGGLGLLLAGLTIQRRDGRRATLPLLQVRSLVSWSPLLAALALQLPPLGAASLSLLAVSAAATAWAALHPTAGISDRLLRTRLTPR